MSSLEDIQAKLKKAEELKLVEFAVHLSESAIRHQAKISKIVAEDAAEAERSVILSFTVEESAIIMQAVGTALMQRLESLRTELGV